MTLLDRLYPLPAELAATSRPYGWEKHDEATILVSDVQDQGVGPDDLYLRYWENQSGGSGWHWKLGFATARELIDFICVAGRGLGCEIEFDELDGDEPDGEPVSSGQREVWEEREEALRRFSSGEPLDVSLSGLVAAYNNHANGSIEVVARVADLVAGDSDDAHALRAEYRGGRGEDEDDEEEVDDRSDDDDGVAANSVERHAEPPISDAEMDEFLEWLGWFE